MIKEIQEFINQHQVWSFTIFFVIYFVLNGIRRFKALDKRIPTEVKLEMRLRRASMALRKLGRAKRLLSRCTAIYNVASNVPMLKMYNRLSFASSNAGEAVSHLKAVLKKVSNLGTSAKLLVKLEQTIIEANEVQKICKNQIRMFKKLAPPNRYIGTVQFEQCQQELDILLNNTNLVVQSWKEELILANKNFTKTMDPVLMKSKAILRNPLKSETSIEDAQTRSILDFQNSQEDLNRVEKCLETLNQTYKLLDPTVELDSKYLATMIGRAMDEIDNCLADTALTLPIELASGETPTEDDAIAPKGLLQEIYEILLQVEIVTWANFACSKLITI